MNHFVIRLLEDLTGSLLYHCCL